MKISQILESLEDNLSKSQKESIKVWYYDEKDLIEDFNDPEIEKFLNQNQDYLKTPPKNSKNVWELTIDIRRRLNDHIWDFYWSISPKQLPAKYPIHKLFSKNLPMDNKAKYYFNSQAKAEDFLMRLKLSISSRQYNFIQQH
jgi:hypothetical protein